MRIAVAAVALCLSLPAWSGEVAPGCVSAAPCNAVAPSAVHHAAEAFARALKQQKSGKLGEALQSFEDAARLAPGNVEYLTAREVARQQLVYQHVQRGNQLAMSNKFDSAAIEYRQALDLDPSNAFAGERLRETLDTQQPTRSTGLRYQDASQPITIRPQPKLEAFQYRGETRGLLTKIAQAFGLKVMLDESVRSRPVRFDIEAVDFYTAMRAASKVAKTFWIPLSADQIFLAADARDVHQTYDRMVLRTFFLSDVGSAQELTDVVNVLRALFEIRFITQQAGTYTITVRAPQRVVDAATQYLEASEMMRPQVMLEVQVFQVSHSLARQIGLSIPMQWSMFNISPSLLASLTTASGVNIQDLINQLFSTGGINQANSTALSALLAQLQSQQNSIFSQPVGTFGGGITRFGVQWPATTANFSLNESTLHSVEHLTLRGAQNLPTTVRIGTRYPILNATFSPIFNTSAISSVIAGGSFTAPFPSFNYEDLGVNLKATPRVQGDRSVTLDLELQVRSLAADSLNGVPVIASTEYKGTVTVADGEMAAVAGALQESDSRFLQGPPGIARVPLLGRALSNENVQRRQDELLIVITPHVLAAPTTGAGPTIPLS